MKYVVLVVGIFFLLFELYGISKDIYLLNKQRILYRDCYAHVDDFTAISGGVL